MKKTVLLSVLLISVYAVTAQKDFEGVLVYRCNITSRSDGVSSATWKKILNTADEVTVLVKNGNFKHVSDRSEIYIDAQKGVVYYKFKGYDTLYYADVSLDTSKLISVTRNANKKSIAGYNCNSITIQTTAGVNTYFYSPAIYMNPQLNQNYKVDREDVFYKETSSLYLSSQQENGAYIYSQNCIKAEQKQVDASAFDLPALPQKKLTPESFTSSFLKLPEFSGKEGWLAYLDKHVDNTVAAKYLKIGRKESSATQTVNVSFMVSETGNVNNAVVDNKKDVNPKLAEEAIRVISISRWRPATVFGQPIPYKLTQPITFAVVKQ